MASGLIASSPLSWQRFAMSPPRPQVVSIALFNQNQVLLIERARWTFPGGRVEQGEGLETAIRREIFEELQLELGDIAVSGPAPTAATGGQFDLTVFFADIATRDLDPDPAEIASFGWFDPRAELPRPTTPELEAVLTSILAKRS